MLILSLCIRSFAGLKEANPMARKKIDYIKAAPLNGRDITPSGGRAI